MSRPGPSATRWSPLWRAAALLVLLALLPPASARGLDPVRQLERDSLRVWSGGQRARAEKMVEKALARAERRHGKGSLETVPYLKIQARLAFFGGRWVRSARLNERILAIQEKSLGPKHPDLAPTLEALARSAAVASDHGRAIKLYRRLLAIKEKQLGPDHQELAAILDSLGMHLSMRRRYREAEKLFARALAIQEKRWGHLPEMLANFLEKRGAFLEMRYAFDRAEGLYRRALAIRVKKYGKDHPRVIGSLVRLAWVHIRRGELGKAESVFKRVLRIQRAQPRPSPTAEAAYLEMLAKVYQDQGRRQEAKKIHARVEKLYLDYLAQQKRAPAAVRKHLVPMALTLLAAHYQRVNNNAKAIPLYEEMLKRQVKSRGSGTLQVATTQLQLARTYEEAQRYADAERLYRASLATYEKLMGKAQAHAPLLLMAGLFRKQGKLREAEKIDERVLGAYRASYGKRSPHVATVLHRLGMTEWALHHTRKAREHFAEAEAIYEPHLALVLAGGTEKDRRAILKLLGGHVDSVVTFHLFAAKQGKEAARLALTLLLRRKGRVLDVLADTSSAIQRRLDPKSKALFRALRLARSKLARLVLRRAGPTGDRQARLAQIAALEDTVRRLASQLSERSAAVRVQTQSATVAAVQKRIPKDAALLEFVSYRKVDPAKWTLLSTSHAERRYAACVLRRSGAPQWFDLGPADAIDRRVKHLRRALAAPGVLDARRRARSLYRKAVRPLRGALGSVHRLLVSPDGALNLVPFAALVDDDGKFLLESFTVSYLTSGRDLLRLKLGMKPRRGPVLVANPDFGSKQAPEEQVLAGGGLRSQFRFRGVRSVDLTTMQWKPLPASAEEAHRLEALLPDVTVLTGARASESELKRRSAPRVLHIATHGFFLPDLGTHHSGTDRPAENPLLRSGLVLSGANRRDDGEDDGILTALEASSLDLWGTRLVVLSACETGVGEVRQGDGVYGLRRALVIAGSESQVMSLWKVDDAATRDLMVGFYKRLKAGKERADALREAQLELLHSPARAHPFFWAAFIESGDWRKLSTTQP